jgi:hypothetical protein
MWNTWDTMRTPMDLSPDAARQVLSRTIESLLASARR